MKFILQSFSVIVLSFILIFPIYAQTGKISGKVIDGASGEALPFVNVMIEGTTLGAATDLDGYFAIIGIRPGTFNVKASAIGYNAQIVQGVKVSIDLTTEINFQLMETSIQLKEEVVVVATKPLVTKDLTSSTAIIGSDEISVLPVTEFQEVLSLKAGIVGDGNVRGGRKGEVVYAIDGVPVTDVYDGSTVVDVSTSSIQELQFVSGAFNAEYGKALSGYVNIATKDGDNNFNGSVSTYFGDYVSDRTDIFRNIDDINPASIRNFEGNLSGPIIQNTLFFYVNARYIYFGGWLEGIRKYNPWNITINRGATYENIEEKYILIADSSSGLGDGEYVPMNWNEKIYAQGKITFRPIPEIKLSYNYMIDDVEYRDFNIDFSYNPDGDFKRFRTGHTNIFGLTHTLSASTFYQANFSYFFKRYRNFVYEDVNDSRWTNNDLLGQEPSEVPSFNTGGTQANQFKRITNTYGAKLDFTSQLDKVNLVKFGVEFNQHHLGFDNVNLLQPQSIENPSISLNPYVKRYVPDMNNPTENIDIDRYVRKPIELSGYVQDKIELSEMIINVGFRLDYFDAAGQVLNDPTDPDIYRPRNPINNARSLDERKLSNADGNPWYRDSDTELKFSPRLGVAFPITDRGVVHFSYGHFFQIPNFELLYTNPEFKFAAGSQENLGVAGNSNLKAQQTISGEVGVQQAFTDELSIDLTAYFRDIRNLAGTRADEIRIFANNGKYSQYVNSDFGFVQGIIVMINKRLSNNWAATIDYTFQSAKGNASDPNANRQAIIDGKQPEVKLIKLNWDQTHTVNATFTYTSEDNWGFSLIGQFGSGFPYSPSFSQNISTLLVNSELKPSSLNVDMRAYKDIVLGDFRLSLFARIYNLFDISNEVNVYNDSGTANFTEDEFNRRTDKYPNTFVNSLDEIYRNPTYYSEPRRIELGATFFF